jgi:putative ABC transport system permease protein
MRALPGVKSASAITFLPFTGLGSATGWYDAARPKPGPGQEPVCDVRIVQPGYFQTMSIPLLRGRDFADSDTAEAPLRFIINETMARKHWPGRDPLGQRIVVHMQNENPPGEIIGVVGDVKHNGLDAEPKEMVYYSHTRLTMNSMTFVLRTDRDPEQLTRAATGVIRALDPAQPVADVRTMTSWIDESVTPARFRMLLLAVFSGVALVLAVVGVYGVVSYSVSQRTHEMGVRVALGARPADILRLVLSRSTLLGVGGIVAGVAGAIALTRWMRSLLFEITPTDAATYITLSLVMILAVVAAALAPARRATKVDPITAIRYE